jgi:hypothetical protein
MDANDLEGVRDAESRDLVDVYDANIGKRRAL